MGHKDRGAGIALLGALAAGWIFLFDRLSLGAVLGFLLLLLAPFAIMLTMMLRRSDEPLDEEGPPPPDS